MAITIPLSAQPGQVLEVPTSWGDVSLSTVIALLEDMNQHYRPAELLCGLRAGGLDNLAAVDVEYIANAVAFSTDFEPLTSQLPTVGLVDIGARPYGTLLLAQQYIEANPDKSALWYGPHVLALYRTQELYGRHDEQKVSACEAALLAAPCLESYADCAFFLSSLERLRRGISLTPKTFANPTTTRWMRVVSAWVMFLGRSLAWIWQRVAPS